VGFIVPDQHRLLPVVSTRLTISSIGGEAEIINARVSERMSGVASTELDISNPMADDADALVDSGLRLPMGNQRVAGQRARAHTFSGESNDLLAVIERLRTRYPETRHQQEGQSARWLVSIGW
ncbi:hypothetical protein FOZ62_012325, partial [Perkinsus olseni]